MQIKKRVVFFADDTLTTFVFSEIALLSKHFEKVLVVSDDKNNMKKQLSNVDFHQFSMSGYSTSRIFFNNFFSVFLMVSRELFANPVWFKSPKLFSVAISSLLRAYYRADVIKEQLLDKSFCKPDDIYYSFWFNDWATALSVMQEKKNIDSFVVRGHGTDLFENRVLLIKRIPFREFQLKHAKRIFSVSKAGMDYLQNKYAQFKDKIAISYLGTEDRGKGVEIRSKEFVIVSCAKIRDIKRIHLLAEALQYVSIPLHWIHLGSENKGDPTLPDLHKNLDKLKTHHSNVRVDFITNLDNDGILEFYNMQHVNLFVSVSETEGLPISMMEAISCGIPILSTDVGGCKEIVTKDTGILISSDPSPKEIALEIERFSSSFRNSNEFRKGVRSFWEKNFNADKNFEQFKKVVLS